MRVAFRVDASVEIGSGHVMRCLSLADSMVAAGHSCLFVGYDLAGDRRELIMRRGHERVALKEVPLSGMGSASADSPGPPHAGWLKGDCVGDALQTAAILQASGVDVLVVDHYALDARWERLAVPPGVRCVVIDDLADRAHIADVLIDQNLGRSEEHYASLVSVSCQMLIGPQFAMLDPRFASVRSRALERRARSGERVRHVLLSMGGVDLPNMTEACLEVLCGDGVTCDISITVVMGSGAPHLASVCRFATLANRSVEVVVDANNMPDLMADADLAVGGAGVTAWERCVVGLPSLVCVLASNQASAARALVAAGAAVLLRQPGDLLAALEGVGARGALRRMSLKAAKIGDGLGVSRVLNAIEVAVLRC